MRSVITLMILAFVAGIFVAKQFDGSLVLSRVVPTPTPTPTAVATNGNVNATPARSAIQETNDRFVKQISARIAGHENEPASQVFKNIQWLKTTPASRLLRIMNGGYSRALGVSCTHCHVEQDFSLDDKAPKRAAREMAVMHRSINEQLRAMKELTPNPNRAINCSTCHRGATDPLSVPEVFSR